MALRLKTPTAGVVEGAVQDRHSHICQHQRWAVALEISGLATVLAMKDEEVKEHCGFRDEIVVMGGVPVPALAGML